jgi:hypothetical protein
VYMPWGILYSAITLTKRIEVFYHCMYTGGVSSPTVRSHTTVSSGLPDFNTRLRPTLENTAVATRPLCRLDLLLEEHVLTNMALSPLSPRLKPRAHI